MQITEYNSSKILRLTTFCLRCGDEGLTNNASLSALKIDKLKEMNCCYWLVEDGDEIVGISGAHHLPEISPTTYRVQFRTAMLNKYQGKGSSGIKKDLTNCIAWNKILPLQITWAKEQGATQIVVTTNTPQNNEDPSGKMFKTDRVFHLLEKQGIVQKVTTKEIYFTLQNVWEVIRPSRF